MAFNKKLKKYKTNFIPVDSEHFSLWYGMNSLDRNFVEKIYLTASGGPLYKINLKILKSFCITSVKASKLENGKKFLSILQP